MNLYVITFSLFSAFPQTAYQKAEQIIIQVILRVKQGGHRNSSSCFTDDEILDTAGNSGAHETLLCHLSSIAPNT